MDEFMGTERYLVIFIGAILNDKNDYYTANLIIGTSGSSSDTTLFRNNIATNSNGQGGGIYLRNSTLTLTCCTITENVSSAIGFDRGGGIYI